MPPQGGHKRKRGDRTYSEDDTTRPSPHRPGNLELARHNQSQSPSYPRNGQDGRGRGQRRSSRGGRYTNEQTRLNTQPAVENDISVIKRPTPAPNDTATLPPNVRSTPDAQNTTSAPDSIPILRLYNFVYLSDAIRDKWQEEGQHTIYKELETALRSGDDITLLQIFQELIHAAVSDSIAPGDAGKIVRDLLQERTDSLEISPQNALIDALSITFEDNSTVTSDALVQFIHSTGISKDVLRQEFDQDLLQKLGMIRSTFGRMGIRKQTNILYRQANFNLMREESEGFAKLITELFTTSGNEPPTGLVVEETVERVKAMIGAFDLDVGRSLDVVLDVFGAVLVKQFRFFVKFLRASPWWPRMLDNEVSSAVRGGLPLWASPGAQNWKLSEEEQNLEVEAARHRDTAFWPQARELGLRAFQQVGQILADTQSLQLAQDADEDDIEQQWIKQTGTMPPNANRDAAQLLGFKLRFYSSSTARDSSDVLPDHLIYLSALLIKIGFISLNDLYPHIWRTDNEMEELRQLKIKEKVEREKAARPGAGAKNALLLAGALADDTLPPPTRLRDPGTRSGTPAKDSEPDKIISKDATKETASEPTDQKILLLKSLLAIGALPEALFILGKFPWVLDLYPELPEYILRIIHHSLTYVYENLRPLQQRGSLSTQKPLYDTDIAGAQKGHVRFTDGPQKRVLRWAQLDRDDSSDGTDYRFYWDEWNDKIPQCQNVEDVFTLCETILPLVGVKIGQDPSLVLKFARIGKSSLIQDSSENNRNRWLDLIKRVLLPSLSLTKPNAGLVNEVFELISYYPTNTRYIMYLEWSSGRVSRNLDVKAAFDQAKAETKDVLKRISKTNVKPMARSLAKIAYANPHVVITTALAQIEVYDSIAEVFVEGSRYFTDLGYDVLNWALISSMARAGRSRTQEGGIFTSRWLSALSQFAGKIYKRYSMMKPGPVLQYVSEQLEKGNSTDLKMLEQIVASMAGIAIDTSFNDAQLQAMGGGPLLQSQTILQLLDRRNDSKTSSRRLIKSLQDHGLISKLLLLMAQLRHSCVFVESDVPLKAIGNTFDEISRIMYQYLDLIRSNLSAEDFQESVPNVVQLLVEYQLPAETAFWIARPLLAKQILESDKDDVGVVKTNGIRNEGNDIEMADANSSEEDGEAVEADEIATTAVTSDELEIDAAMDTEVVQTNIIPEIWNPVLKSVMDQIQGELPTEIIDTIGVGFFVTFWQLSLYDISVPSKSYEDEMGRQKKKISSVTADRTNISASGAKAREATVKQHQKLIDDLLAENKDHLKAYSESRARLQREKEQWFANKQRHSTEINSSLMEYCFLPRILASPQDAFFCFKFAKFLHSNGTPNFRTLGFYDSFCKPDRLASLIFICTSKESDNLGRFLCELLRDLARWHRDKNVYEREAFGSKRNLPGFAMKVENGKPQLLLDFENFRRILFKWHSNLYAALVKCLSSSEYMHVRNAISILRIVSPVYPSVNFHGTTLQKSVDKLRNSDREDLKVASQALLGALHRREKEWVIPQAFRQGQSAEKSESENKIEIAKAETVVEKTGDDTAKKEDDGEVEESSTAVNEAQKDPTGSTSTLDTKARPSPVPESVEPSKDRSRPSTANDSPAPPRAQPDNALNGRRSARPLETTRSHDLPRRISPSRPHQTSASLPSRPELDSRNGPRDSPRTGSRPLPAETARSDSRSSHSRYGLNERSQDQIYDQSHRHPRSHDRPAPSERDDRGRRDHGSRSSAYEDRRETERDARSDYSRINERDTRGFERDYGRAQYEQADRKRPDLLDDHRLTPSAPSRNAPLPSASGAINPDRAALITNVETRSGMSIRGQAQEKARNSRQTPPPRDEERRHASRPEREERSDRMDRPDRPDRSERNERPERPDRRQDLIRSAQPSPAPPHARSGPSNNYGRDARSYNEPVIDMQHGRLEPESPHRPPPRGERPGPESDVPSGPRAKHTGQRMRGGPTNQPPSAPTAAPSSAQIPSTSQQVDRPPPTGPAKHTRNNSNFDQGSNPKPADTSGVHPDRMNLVVSQDSSRPSPRPPPLNTQSLPPSGPRNGGMVPPSGPSPSTRGPPTGPQMDGAGRGRRHPLAAVNSTLAQATGPNGRGRGGSRQSGGHFPPPLQSPVQGTRPDFGPQNSINPNDVPVQPRPQSSRRDSSRDMRNDEDVRGNRTRHERDNREGGKPEDGRRSEIRSEGQREQRNFRTGPHEEVSSRKHHREDSSHFPSGHSRGGGRIASDSKRPRRGA